MFSNVPGVFGSFFCVFEVWRLEGLKIWRFGVWCLELAFGIWSLCVCECVSL